METPLQLLEKRLFELEKALSKSFNSFKSGQINKETHLTHKSNLEPKIFEYKQAVDFLKQWILN